MEEFNSTEAEVVTEAESGEQEDVVDLSENHDFDLVDEDSADEQTEEADENQNDGHGEAVAHQSGADNHAARLARLKAERDARRQAESMRKQFEDEFLSAGVVNPYTEKPFESLAEYKEYGQKVKEADRQARADRDGKTIEEIEEEDAVRDEIRKRKTTKEEPKESNQDFINDDLLDFMEQNPDIDPAVVINNKQFIRFAGTRFGKEPLAALYKDYADLVHTAERSVKADTRSARSTGSGSTGGERLTSAQRKALDEWNEANPDMKMTPSEFLKR